MEQVWMRIEELVNDRQRLQRIINYRLEVISQEQMDFIFGGQHMVQLSNRYACYSDVRLLEMKQRAETELDHMLDNYTYQY